jgi:polyhydroxybutyrate depolymerase
MKKIQLTFCALLVALSGVIAQNQITVIDSIKSGGIFRNYRLYIPQKYEIQKPSALIIDLHGYNSNAMQEQVYSNFMPIADTANFFVVYPNGSVHGGAQYWNAGITTLPAFANDVAFISELIDHLRSLYSIDENRVYACGMSNGGFMAHTLACALNNKIAAIASVTGSMFLSQYTTCVPSRVVPVMQMHGTADKTVPFIGNSSMMPLDTLMNFWAKHNKCDAAPDIDTVPDINKADSCKAIHYFYKNGAKGSTCEFYKIIGGGHSWPGAAFKIDVTNQDFNATEKIWLFFRKYKLSDMVGIEEWKANEEARMSIYPNPCMDQLNIEGETIQLVNIVDLTGKLILSSTSKQIDVSTLSKGIYSVILISKKHRLIKKLVKI